MTRQRTEEEAHRLDAIDPGHRELFHVPPSAGGRYPDIAYLAGNSLGLQPRAVRADLLTELDTWAALGVEGHHEGARPWYSYHELLREPAARLAGGLSTETVAMGSLTVNLHLLMVSFYRPTPQRYRILIEDAAFPSDSYAVRSQAAFHGYEPDDAVVRLAPRAGEDSLRTGDVEAVLADQGREVALVLLGGVNYLTGEVLDIQAITAAGHEAGAIVGWDLAHAIGNIPLQLHDWDVDLAAWCSYKYLNGGPGAVAGVFVHEKHIGNRDLPRLEGWWSTDPATRFAMAPVADPPERADAWQVSNPPILALAPVRTSLALFDEISMTTLRERSQRLTSYLLELLDEVAAGAPVEIVTPREPERRGCQLSLRLPRGRAAELAHALRREDGVVVDTREPDIVRAAPVPLYSTYHDCWRFADALARQLPQR